MIMGDNLSILEFDAEKIESAYTDVVNELKQNDIDETELDEAMPDALNKGFSWYNPTKTFIETLYAAAKEIVLKHYPSARVVTDISGMFGPRFTIEGTGVYIKQ